MLKIGVIGAGTMGHGIAELFAIKGHAVCLIDVNQRILDGARNRILDSLKRLRSKDVLREDPGKVMDNLEFSTRYEVLSQADLVIEAVPEELELKRSVFQKLEAIVGDETILASNTSSIPISQIARDLRRKERVVGLHFFNPPILMKLVEVVPTPYTGERAILFISSLAEELGKIFLFLRKEVPGLASNRIFLRLVQEACREVEEGEATVEQIDSAARTKLGLPMGPFELADYVGLDVVISIWRVVTSSGSPDVPCSTFKEKLKRGELGVKSGKGFYVYPEPGLFVKPKVQGESPIQPEKLIALAANEASWIVSNGVLSLNEVETLTKFGLNFPKGIFEMVREIGPSKVLNTLLSLSKRGLRAYSPDPLLVQMYDT